MTDPAGASTYSTANGDGDFPVTADVTGVLAKTVSTSADLTNPDNGLGLGCTPASFAGTDFTKKIALISRGDCSFAAKVDNASTAGAAAVIIVNNKPGDPIAMAGDPALKALPAVMSPQADLGVLVGKAGDGVKIDKQKQYTYSGNNDIMGDFSSQGPTDVDYRVKPDLVAPGVSVLSSIPLSFCDAATNSDGCWAFFNGTSMASPHLAGTAAVVRAAHPGWTAEQVRSAITNTAQQNALFNYANITEEGDRPARDRRRPRRRAGRTRRQGGAVLGQHLVRCGAVGQRQVAEQDGRHHQPDRCGADVDLDHHGRQRVRAGQRDGQRPGHRRGDADGVLQPGQGDREG